MWSHLRCSKGEQHGSSEGPCGPLSGHAGTGLPRQQSLGSGLDIGLAGRSSPFAMASSELYGHWDETGFCPDVPPVLGYYGSGRLEGARDPHDQAGRGNKPEAESWRCKCRPKGQNPSSTKKKRLGRATTRQLLGGDSMSLQRSTPQTLRGPRPFGSQVETKFYQNPIHDKPHDEHLPRSSPSPGEQFNKKEQHEAFEPSDACSHRQGGKISPDLPQSSSFSPRWTSDILGFSFSFTDWCMSLTRKVLACRTSFGNFLASTLVLRRDGPPAHDTALFPLPLPCFWPNAPVVPKLPGARKRKMALMRALHVVVSALNFVYCARGFPPLDLLRRQPNPAQQRALDLLRVLLSACDPGSPVEVASSGRRNLQLLARLQELSEAADALGFRANPYHEDLDKIPVQVDNSWNPKLSPFSEVTPSRLKITGTGNWKVDRFLSPELYMPFVEPKILEYDIPVHDRGVPNLTKEKPQIIFELLQKWDSLDLLELHPASAIGLSSDRKVRIFGAHKDLMNDRQIGDRRLQNGYEGRIPGPSRELPTGALLTRLIVKKGKGLRICVTDRADFYHQIGVSHERSQTNCAWPAYELAEFEGTKAYDRYLERILKVRGKSTELSLVITYKIQFRAAPSPLILMKLSLEASEPSYKVIS